MSHTRFPQKIVVRTIHRVSFQIGTTRESLSEDLSLVPANAVLVGIKEQDTWIRLDFCVEVPDGTTIDN